MIALDTIPLTEFHQPETVRLISTAYIDEPAMAPLADDPDELGFLEDLEGLTSARRGGEMILPPGVHPDELLSEWHGYGWSYVNAAFCYTRATGSRFNGPDRGAWYATWGEGAVETAHAEVRWHLTREFEAVGIFENVTSYRELFASFATQMHDLSGFDGNDVLSQDPMHAYPAGQALATRLRADGCSGVLYPSVRRSGGNCLAAFRPNLVQNIRQGGTWLFQWTGSVEPTIRLI